MDLFLSFLLSFGTWLSDDHQEQLSKSLTQLTLVYSSIPMDLVVEKNYFIAFNADSESLHNQVLETDCKKNSQFSEVPANMVTSQVVWSNSKSSPTGTPRATTPRDFD
jgi:hypothetical protein